MANANDLILAPDVFANRPAAGRRGRFFFATDRGVIYRDNGSAWVEWPYDANYVTYTPGVLSDWDYSSDPGDVQEALDQLASRVADEEAEAGGAGGGALTYSAQTLTTANLAATEEYFYDLTIAGLTADRDVNLPTPSAAGKRVKLRVLDGDDQYEAIIKADGAEITSLFIEGETLELMSYGTGAGDWRISEDGRIGCVGELTKSTDETINTAATWTIPQFDTAGVDIGDIADLTNKGFLIRRTGYYEPTGIYHPANSVTDQNYVYSAMFVDSSIVAGSGTIVNYMHNVKSGAGSNISNPHPGRRVYLTRGQYISLQYFTQGTNIGWESTAGLAWFSIKEV